MWRCSLLIFALNNLVQSIFVDQGETKTVSPFTKMFQEEGKVEGEAVVSEEGSQEIFEKAEKLVEAAQDMGETLDELWAPIFSFFWIILDIFL